MNVRAIIFDLDGVLVDSAPAWRRTINAVRRSEGLAIIPNETLDRAFGQSTAADAAVFFAGRMTEAALAARYEEELPKHLEHARLTEPDVVATLAALAARGLSMGVATNAPRASARMLLHAIGLADRFEAVVTPEDVSDAKPAPDALFAVLRSLGVVPGEALFVGDTATDLEAGRRAGVVTIGYRLDGGARRIERLGELQALTPDRDPPCPPPRSRGRAQSRDRG